MNCLKDSGTLLYFSFAMYIFKILWHYKGQSDTGGKLSRASEKDVLCQAGRTSIRLAMNNKK